MSTREKKWKSDMPFPDISKRVEWRIKRMGFQSPAAFAQGELQMNRGTFYKIVHGHNLTVDTVMYLAEKLKMRPEWFFISDDAAIGGKAEIQYSRGR